MTARQDRVYEVTSEVTCVIEGGGLTRVHHRLEGAYRTSASAVSAKRRLEEAYGREDGAIAVRVDVTEQELRP